MLIGESNWSAPSGERKPINIHPEVREKLVRLLFEPEMQGVGYSEFLNRACDEAYSQIHRERDEVAQRGKS
jgi:hypothetical protein